MNTCVTSATITALAAALLAGVAVAEPLELHGETELGLRFYDLEAPFDNDDLSGFFDQYRYIGSANADVPWFLDLMETDVGLLREDGTPLLHFQRSSPHWQRQGGLLELDWEGLEFDVDYHRWRDDELRVYPVPTGGSVPTFGTVFTPDPAPGPLGKDRRLYVRRTGVGGEVRLRPDGFDLAVPLLSEVQLRSHYEKRDGKRQDRFLLDDSVEPSGALPATARWRANRRDLDQEVAGVGGGLVFRPLSNTTAVLDVDYESFREHADEVLLSEIAAGSPVIPAPSTPARAARGFFYVPDTDRLTGSLRAAGRVRDVQWHASGFLTHLEQEGLSSLQRIQGVDDNSVTTTSLSGGFDAPLPAGLDLNGYAKVVWRNNNIDTAAFDDISSDGQQVNVYMRRRREFTGGLEMGGRPSVGSRLALGFRTRLVARSLRRGSGFGAVPASYSLIKEDSEEYTIYLRGHARLMRGLSVSSEVGTSWAPQVGLPRELEHSVYAEGRGSYSFSSPFPITASAFGRWRDGDNDEIELYGDTPGLDQRKDYEVSQWSYGLTLTAQPQETVTLFTSFVHDVDRQRFAHVRSNLPRTFGFGLEFFLDSDPLLETELRTFMLGAHFPLLAGFDASTSGSMTWVRARFPAGGNTADILEGTNQIDQRILSLETVLGYDFSSRWRGELGYRYDDLHDSANLEALELGTDVHTYTLSVRYAF